MLGLFSLPGMILLISFSGFAAFAAQSGIPMAQAVFMTGIIWALPAKVILVGSIVSGAPLIAAFLAVTLSSIRLMPMIAALIPEIRTAKTPSWALLLVSHLIAITAWVMAMERVQAVPRPHRLAFVAALGLTLTLSCMALVALVYPFVSTFPPLVAGCLFFLTPVYFLASIWSSARQRVIPVALVIGLFIGPFAALAVPDFDILVSGIGGGTLAWMIERAWRKREGKAA
ncbi:AzlC family protein [Rhizobium rhizosphaerae]|uniref:AzlC family protein n=1 Tax=Xaviernesmea rhizosphaerae TaxID=1672749 RepID=A0A1Q9AJR8_9HYPH|nr:AzlC family ABC transporter permease [Xaviernesmea rhizosphaerae]OLP55487.1 AzlC family protein [Xaviernesmea rhizosphaerae]